MLIDAVVALLRSDAGPPFGDDGTDAGCKFFADYAAPEVALPFAVVTEVGEAYRWYSPGPDGIKYLANGQLQVDIYASDRAESRRLGDFASFVVSRSDPDPADGPVMSIQLSSARSIPVVGTGPDTPTLYQRTLIFGYQQQRSLING